MTSKNCFYTMKQVAEELGISRPKLFKFLKRYNIIVDGKPRAEFILMGYLNYSLTTVKNSTFQKKVYVTFVSTKGMKWLQKVMSLFEVNNMNEWV